MCAVVNMLFLDGVKSVLVEPADVCAIVHVLFEKVLEAQQFFLGAQGVLVEGAIFFLI